LRKLYRPEAPEILRENAARWTENYLERRHFYWPKESYPSIREKLGEMTQTHCAFCDGPLGVESRETVEHFRPKSQFPELAYTWDNLFPCCDVCQSSKREAFHELLLKPDAREYRFSRYFMVDYRTGAIEASAIADETGQQSARITVGLYGLNSPARKRARLRELEYYRSKDNPVLDDYSYRFFLES